MAAINRRVKRVQPINEFRSNTEVSTTAANGPEQIRVFVFTNLQDFTLRRNNLRRKQIIDGDAMQTVDAPQAAAQGKSACTSMGNHSCRCYQAMFQGCRINVAQ